MRNNLEANIVFNLTYLAVTDLAFASSAPPKTQVKTALGGPMKKETLTGVLFFSILYVLWIRN